MAARRHHKDYHGTDMPSVEVDRPRWAPFSTNTLPFDSRYDVELPLKRLNLTASDIQKEAADCHWCQLAAFSTHHQYPVQIMNDVDNTELPKNFRFIEHSILRSGVERADEAFRSGCDCAVDAKCEEADCECLQDIDSEGTETSIQYEISGPYKDCLKQHMLDSSSPLYECQEKCSCSRDCSNRVVERGRRIPLEIFRTSDGRGWGVRSSVNIIEGQLIDRYVGEIITGEESLRRRELSESAQRKDVYLFALDKFSDPLNMDPRLAGDPYEVDGEFFSGPTRFVNHSCDPNLRIFARVGEVADRHIHDLAFFAIENIPAGTELTFDYVDGIEDVQDDSKDPEKQKDMTRCLCGSDNCRQWLW